MKPKLVCAHCSTEITRQDKFCSSCGTKVEWDDTEQPSAQQQKPESVESPGEMEKAEQKPAADHIMCDVCGYNNEPTARYCESCGAGLEDAQKAAQKPPAASAQSREKPKQPKRSKRKQPQTVSSGKVISIAAAVLLLGFAAYIFVIDRDASHTHDQPAGMGGDMGTGGAEMEQAIMQEIERLEHELDHHDSENEEAMLRLANLYHDVRQFDNAIRYYREYIERNPDNPDVRVDLGICYFEAGQPDRAVETVEDVRHDFPGHQLAAFNLGIIYLNLGEVEPANKNFEAAYEINPDNQTGQRARRIIDEHTF